MSIESFHRRRENFDVRVKRLSKSVEELRAKTGGDDADHGVDWTRRLFDEIGVALEELAIAERELREYNQELLTPREECEVERRRYRQLFDFCPDAYIVSDLEGNITEANVAAGEMLGLPPQQLCGQPLLEFVVRRERSTAAARLRDLVDRSGAGQHGSDEKPRLGHWELRFVGRDGRAFHGSVKADIVPEANRAPESVRWLIRDITSQREAEAALQAMREQVQRAEQLTTIGTLAAGLGHDVKNLLFPVRCRLDALAQRTRDPVASEDVEVVRQAVRYLQQLATNLQMLAEKRDNGFDPDRARPVTDVLAWWEQVHQLVEAGVRKRISLSYEFEPNLPPIAIAPHLLTQVIVNLVNNANRAIEDAGSITIWAKRDAAQEEAEEDGAATNDDSSMVMIGVTDDGPGMTEREIVRILESSAKDRPAQHGLSTGMGLQLVRSIVHQAAGSFKIASSPGKGTTIALRLPAALDEPDAGSRASADGPIATVSLSDPHIASSMCTLLNLSRLPARRMPPEDPGPCALWVTEPELISEEQARQFLEEDPRRKLVMLGSSGAAGRQMQKLPAIWIERPASPRIILDALSEVVHEILSG